MTIDSTFKLTTELGLLGNKSGKIFVRLNIAKPDWFVTMHAFYPNDRRFKAPLIELRENDLSRLSSFLKGMLTKIDELKLTIATNKLFEDELVIQRIYIHYMIRNNKVDIRFYFPYRAGIGVYLSEDEVKNMLSIFDGLPSKVDSLLRTI